MSWAITTGIGMHRPPTVSDRSMGITTPKYPRLSHTSNAMMKMLITPGETGKVANILLSSLTKIQIRKDLKGHVPSMSNWKHLVRSATAFLLTGLMCDPITQAITTGLPYNIKSLGYFCEIPLLSVSLSFY